MGNHIGERAVRGGMDGDTTSIAFGGQGQDTTGDGECVCVCLYVCSDVCVAWTERRPQLLSEARGRTQPVMVSVVIISMPVCICYLCNGSIVFIESNTWQFHAHLWT